MKTLLDSKLKEKNINLSQEEREDLQNLVDKAGGNILLLCVSGSHSYGLAREGKSDFDFRGVFVQDTLDVLSANPTNDGNYPYTPQLNDEKNDMVLYEVGRFIELLEKGNPNILELLNIPEEWIIYKNPLFDYFFKEKELYLTKKLKDTFIGYAHSQIGKAKGLNKKIHNPQPKERKNVLDFCYVIEGNKSISFWEWVKTYYRYGTENFDKNQWNEVFLKHWGVVKVNNGEQLYCFYPNEDQNIGFRGVLKDLNSQEIRLTSIPKELAHKPHIIVSYNLNGFQVHCKDHKEYWEWVEKRNPQRYLDNIKANTNFDLKNIMHCVRLVEMAEDIILKKQIVTKRPNREYLLSIRNGEVDYDTIMDYVNKKLDKLDDLFQNSSLPHEVDYEYTRNLLKEIRLEFLKY